MRSRFILLLALLLAAVLVGCNRTKRYAMQGDVVAKDSTANEITVSTGNIPGFMEAMTMSYRVNDPVIVREVEPGDKISAEVVVGSDRSDYWLENVRITDKAGRGKIKLPVGSKMLPPGTLAPKVTLVNQDGRKIHFDDFKGKAVLVTFIYTRCPMPEFCPRLSSEFARIQNELKKTPDDYSKTHLLTISFDPKYDTPAVLRKYGLNYLDGDKNGFSHWDFASTNPDDMHRLAESFGLEYGGDENQITHSMVIVLIAPNGRVSNYWSTDWTWTELIASLQHTARDPSQAGRN